MICFLQLWVGLWRRLWVRHSLAVVVGVESDLLPGAEVQPHPSLRLRPLTLSVVRDPGAVLDGPLDVRLVDLHTESGGQQGGHFVRVTEQSERGPRVLPSLLEVDNHGAETLSLAGPPGGA